VSTPSVDEESIVQSKLRSIALVAALAAIGVMAAAAPSQATPGGSAGPPSPPRAAAPPAGADPSTVDPARRNALLPAGWQTSGDMMWFTTGDANALHLMVADARSGYTWRTAAALSEPGIETDQWVGNACLTSSGRRAVVVYAPREFTNRAELSERGGFTAVVDLTSGAVTKLPLTTSLAYFNPGCGSGETATLTQEGGESLPGTRLIDLDAATARLGSPIATDGQVTSAIPTAQGIAAARGSDLVLIDNQGRQRRVATTAGPAFRLRVDAAGGLDYLDHAGTAVRVRRTVGTATTTLATGKLGTVGLTAGSGGRVFITGTPDRVSALPAAVSTAKAPASELLSTSGETSLRVNHQDTRATAAANPTLQVTATVLARHTALPFTFQPGLRPTPRVADGARARGPAPAQRPKANGAAAPQSLTNDPTDPDRSCSVPRNDVHTQVYQPTARQVEWAADEAVQNSLTLTRPANWKQSGMPSYSPQGLFPPLPLSGSTNEVPPQILLGVLSQESNLWQASGHDTSGEYGNPLIGDYYGLALYDGDPSNDWDIDWSNADCGYGIAQITDGMRLAGQGRPGEVAMPASSQRAVAMDYTVNIAAGLRILESKWNQVYDAGLIVNNGDPASIENWFYAAWAYNSGFHEDQGNNTSWGLGWANNPANPDYPADREPFLENTYDDARTPQYWPYEEKVLGWAGHPIDTGDGPGFRAAWWTSIANRITVKPPVDLFCDASDSCYPGQSFTSEFPTEPAGPCAMADLSCWYHEPAKWKACATGNCGFSLVRFDTSYPEQPDGTNFPPNCGSTGLPPGALVIDDLPDSVTSAVPCGHTSSGTFNLSFSSDSTGHYPDKIDLHQLGGGFGAHFWFAHTWSAADMGGELAVSGTWTLNRQVNGWGRVLVHMPDHGAYTRGASYLVGLGNGTSEARIAPQRTMGNNWVSLGVFSFAGTPQVTLSNVTNDGNGTEDVAWDAVAVQPLPAKPTDIVVSLGDSYSSGENASGPDGVDYYPQTDVDGDNPPETDLCHRSRLAWSRKGVLADSGASIGMRSDNWDSTIDYHLLACSGAVANNVSGNVPWNGEQPQLLDGYLDKNTTLVTISIGGNDARFAPIIAQCVLPASALKECEDTTLPGDTGTIATTEPVLIKGPVHAAMLDTLTKIHALAPSAKVILMGYPRLMADHAGCLANLGIDTNEETWINSMADLMASEQQTVVQQAQAAGVPATFADPRTAFDGKGVCGSPEDISGILLFDAKSPGEPSATPQSQQSFHPTPDGTTVYANVFDTALRTIGQ
jgi:hypothetical protein